jgi:hypothetical protein
MLLALTPSTGLTKSIILTDGQTQLRVTDEPVQRRCVVVASSGSYEADQHACGRALAAIPSNAAGIPEGTYLFPGRDRRYTNGTCAYPTGVRPTTAEEAVCAQLLNSMGKARVTMAIEPERWVRPADLKDLSRNPGRIMVSIGVSTAGRASYCAVMLCAATLLISFSYGVLVLASRFEVWRESNKAGLTLQSATVLLPFAVILGLKNSKDSFTRTATVFAVAWTVPVAGLLFFFDVL